MILPEASVVPESIALSIPGVFCSSSIILSILALLSHSRGPAGDHMGGVPGRAGGTQGD